MRSPLRGAHKTKKPKGGWCSLPLRGKLSDKEARRGPEGATHALLCLKVGVANTFLSARRVYIAGPKGGPKGKQGTSFSPLLSGTIGKAN